jgi:hypothetical protein
VRYREEIHVMEYFIAGWVVIYSAREKVLLAAANDGTHE